MHLNGGRRRGPWLKLEGPEVSGMTRAQPPADRKNSLGDRRVSRLSARAGLASHRSQRSTGDSVREIGEPERVSLRMNQ
jgi:hypothetical protein